MVICRIAKIELIDTTCATLYRTIKRIVFDGLFALANAWVPTIEKTDYV